MDSDLALMLRVELDELGQRLAELEIEHADIKQRRQAISVLLRPDGYDTLHRLGGPSLRAAVAQLLEAEDPARAGMRYDEITRRLLEIGCHIGGSDPVNNVRATIGCGRGLAVFELRGAGVYALRSPAPDNVRG